MPIEYRYVEEHELVVTTFSGVVTDEELLAHGHRIGNDERIPWGHREVVDMRTIDSVTVTSPGIASLIDIDRRSGKASETKLAIVAPKDVVFGLSRAYQIRSKPDRPVVEVFRTIEEAAEWLGVPSAVI
jgi:hypothetical protein